MLPGKCLEQGGKLPPVQLEIPFEGRQFETLPRKIFPTGKNFQFIPNTKESGPESLKMKRIFQANPQLVFIA